MGVVITLLNPARAKTPPPEPFDPIFEVIEAHRAANAEWDRRLRVHNAWIDRQQSGITDEDDPDWPKCQEAGDREGETWWRLWRTMPTTPEGRAALFEYFQSPRWPMRLDSGDVDERLKYTVFSDAVMNVWRNEPGRSEGDGGVPSLAEWLRSMEVAFRLMSPAA